ncbi:transglutaminase domain-containing protein [Candidatus Dojkabacteria bacterium]|nr:transglutaminase domain-containing protein [Candidatus Dojkabacteria bacterium]
MNLNDYQLYIRMKIIKAILLTTFILLNSLLSPAYILAANEDFVITSDIEMKYSYPNEYVEISETYGIKINNPDYFYRSGMEQTFYIRDFKSTNDSEYISSEREFKKKSIKVIDSNNLELKYTLINQSDGMLLKTNTNTMINSNNDYHITVTYNTHDLTSLNGNISNIYIPGIPKDTKFTEKEGKFGLAVKYNFSATLFTNTDAPELSHLQPANTKVVKNENSIKYTIPVEERLGKNAWVQLGTNQYYYFRIEQEAKQTDFITPEAISDITDLASSNIYRIALPREYEETKQSTLIKSITPEPYKIERDEEGNIFALFKIPANADKTITIEGYIKQSKLSLKDQKELPKTSLEVYKSLVGSDSKLEKYIKPDRYWESNDPTVLGIANKLYEGTSTIDELIRKDYEYVVDTFDYSYDKLKEGNNVRLGAKAALTGSQTICMEYSDALTAILRAQGIPARIAIGYGNDPTGAENKVSNIEPVRQTIAHQWTQVWIPDYGWQSVDPTWGESEREYIGSDLDHILWYSVGFFDEKIADTTVYTADSITSSKIGEYRIYLQALDSDSFNNIEGIEETSTLVDKYKDIKSFDVDFTIRTSMLGRILVYIIPAVTVFTLVLITTLLTKIIIKKLRQSSPSPTL